MAMRGSVARAAAVRASAEAFGWDRPLLATLRHSTLAFGETATPLGEARELGGRDRLSLLAQFAAHQGLLQFAGVADGELDPGEWAVVQRRGADIRLVRIAARAPDPSTAPPVLTLAQQFAEAVGAAALEVLKQSWARAEAVYAEAFARLAADISADLRWTRRSAYGEVASPGAEGLRALFAERGRYTYDDPRCAECVALMGERVVRIGGGSPLQRYSALGALAADVSESALAERLLPEPYVYVIDDPSSLDAASRHVVQLLAAGAGTWVVRESPATLPRTRRFVIAPRIALRRSLDERVADLASFVDTPAFDAFLRDGTLPPGDGPLLALTEPKRSYVGALALLGTRIPRELASRFLTQFLFDQPLEQLAVDGATTAGDEYVFASDAVREQAIALIPAASRASLCRVAAELTGSPLLYLDAGDVDRAVALLEQNPDPDALQRVPRSALTPRLACALAHELLANGRYRDARELAPLLADDDRELVLAIAERRCGDYAPSLARIERLPGAAALRAELLILVGRYDEAADVLADRDDPYLRGILAVETGGEVTPIGDGSYLAARLDTYAAIARGDLDAAARHAADSIARARCTTERIDATLDRVFTLFTAGRWSETREEAMEVLALVEETQGDRAAGGILFTLAYLAADAGQWAHAAQRITRLRHFYSGTHDERRLRELELLAAHLDFSRGRFAEARRAAAVVFRDESLHAQIREAAALILDEIDWVEHRDTPLRSAGRSGNVELTARHRDLVARRGGAIDANGSKLRAFRIALRQRDDDTARALAQELDLVYEPPQPPSPHDDELRLLRAAATAEFPFAPDALGDVRWRFATRNRLGHWSEIGSLQPLPSAELDRLAAAGERELLFVEGMQSDALAAIFRLRAEHHRLRRLVEQEESAPARGDAVDGIVGRSPAMRDVYTLVTKVAKRDVPVCVLGESGTGKELVARAIHRHSARKHKTFTAVNCAALPENLIESELFGHVRGAFTGADRDRAGLIETTDGGTLFLDEIGEMPLTAQAKLLRFLQEGEFRRVGDTVNRSADVRIVSATNRKLETAVEEGRFREDLYYRIRGVELALPPLRERAADIPLLAAHFLAMEKEKHRGGPSRLSPDAESAIAAYSWPGNVRELQNTLRGAHALAGDAREIEINHLPDRLRQPATPRTEVGSYQDAVARFRRDLIEKSLVQAKGNQNQAAALLKMSRQALAYQIRELGILVEKKRYS